MRAWHSLEALTSLTWWLRGISVGLTLAGGLCMVASLVTGKRIETLREAREANRDLTATQRRQIVEFLKAWPTGRIDVRSPITSREPRQYALQFVEVLKEARWQVTFNDDVIFAQAPTDLRVLASNATRKTSDDSVVVAGDAPARAVALHDVLKLANLPVRLEFSASVPPDGVQLIVGFKP